MKSNSSKTLSPFAQSALNLDADFNELERLSHQLECLDVESDFGLEQARKILLKFGECGTRAGEGVQTLAKTLNESRVRAEAAAQAVANRAAIVEAYHQKQQILLARFQMLGDTVKKVTEGIGTLKKANTGSLQADEKAEIEQHLPELTSSLGILIEQARLLKDEAQAAKLKSLEKNAHALSQTLTSAQNKLGSFLKQ